MKFKKSRAGEEMKSFFYLGEVEETKESPYYSLVTGTYREIKLLENRATSLLFSDLRNSPSKLL